MFDRILVLCREDLLTWGMIAFGLILLSGCGTGRDIRRMRHSPSAPEISVQDYRIFDRLGRPAAAKDIVDAAAQVDAVFIGETHGDPAAHHLERKILSALYERYGRPSNSGVSKRTLILSMEMFERDVQVILDEYLQDLITEGHFQAATRPWSRYLRDYRPIVEFAKDHSIPVIAANAPRRYVNRVSRLGPDSLTALSDAAKSWLPPLPYPPASPEYRRKFLEFWGESSHPASGDMPPTFENLLSAQSLWDAAMGHAVAEALDETPGALVVNINGKFHSAENLGAVEKLHFYRPGTEILTVTIIPSKTFPEFNDRYLGYGDFVILTDPDANDPPG